MSAVSGRWRAASGFASESGTDSFPLFDWLRFALASVVALVHAGLITWGPSGLLAVNVFFALSGWLIGGILLRTTADHLPRFFFNRGMRIWVPYLLAVAAVYATGAARDGTDGLFWEYLFYDLTFTHNYFVPKVPEVIATMPLEGTGTHFWTIAVEEQFYLGAPLLMVLFPWGRHLAIWAAIAAAMYLLDAWYASISLGVLAAVARQRLGPWYEARAARWVMAPVALALFAGLVIQPERFPVYAPPLSVLVVLLAASGGVRRPLGTFLGGLSYPLYLNHWMGVFGANFLAWRLGVLPGWLAPFVGYGLSVAVAAVAYVLVDRAIQRRRSALYTRRRGVTFAAFAYGLMAVGITGGLSLDLAGRFGI